MRYKMIISDFDGTLLRSDATISAQTVEAIKRYRMAGGIFTIATGRMYASIKNCLKMAGLEGADILIATYQGLMINDASTDKMLYINPLERSLACEILRYAQKTDTYAHIYILDEDGQDRLYFSGETEEGMHYAKYCGVEYVVVGDLIDYIMGMSESRKIIKIMMFKNNCDMKAEIESHSKLFPNATFTASTSFLLEAINKTGGKHRASQFMSEYYGIDKSQIVCCGDNYNDIEMIKFAGLGCAMQNAVDLLKQSADLIIPSNDDNGIGFIIDKVMQEDC